MTRFLIVRRSLSQHAVSSVLTILALALGSGLVMALFNVNRQATRAFTGGNVGFDAVLGARGSDLQLVLNTVFHLETSPGNIPWDLYQQIRSDPRVELAIPYAVGDNYRGFRIVGTTPEIFTEFEYRQGQRMKTRSGQVFDPRYREAVIGSLVAERTGLKRGDKFSPYHGFQFQEDQRHAEEYVVVGILEPTGSPSDRVVWIPLEGIFRLGGHVLRGKNQEEEFRAKAGEEIPDEFKEVSAVMLKFRSPQAGIQLSRMINQQGTAATLAWPIGAVMAELFEKMGWMNKILEVVAYLVVLVAMLSVLISLYNTMNERRREFAILRALGARRGTVFSVIVLEAVTIAAMGSLVGVLVQSGILLASANLIQGRTGVVLSALAFHPALLWTPLAMMLLGALAGMVPAMKAYRTHVADNLSPTS